MAKKNLLIYTEGFRHAFLAEGVNGVNNLESSLNGNYGNERNRITLVGARGFSKKDDIYVPSDHQSDCPVLNTNHIDFIYGSGDMLYNPNAIKKTPVSILWGMGLRHRIVGEVMVAGNNVARFDRNKPVTEQRQKNLELLNYLEKQTASNFIPLYNPRADSVDAEKEFISLFDGLPVKPSRMNRILVNNKKQSNSYTGHAIYFGESSQNFK